MWGGHYEKKKRFGWLGLPCLAVAWSALCLFAASASGTGGPQIEALSVHEGSAGGGTAVEVKGRNFGEECFTAVLPLQKPCHDVIATVAGEPAFIVAVIPEGEGLEKEALFLCTPEGPPGEAEVQITTLEGSSPETAAARFTFTGQERTPTGPPPTLTYVVPGEGSASGFEAVTVKGSHLLAEGSASGEANNLCKEGAYSGVRFGSRAASLLRLKSSPGAEVEEVEVLTPPAANQKAKETVVVSARTSSGGESKTDTSFTYSPLPKIFSLSPTKGPEGGGQKVVIEGRNLGETKAVSFVGAGEEKEAKILRAAAGALEVETPSHPASELPLGVKVTTPYGTTELPEAYTYVARPTVTLLKPAQAPSCGGTRVTIEGEHLAEATAVSFGNTKEGLGEKEGDARYEGEGILEVTVPPHPAGAVAVTVTTAGGTSEEVAAATLHYENIAPQIKALEPLEGSSAGGEAVVIKGSYLNAPLKVTFGGVAAEVLSSTLEEVTVHTPPHAPEKVTVGVETYGGSTTAATPYTYIPPPRPVVVSLSPLEGPTGGGTVVEISGRYLSGATAVYFGSAKATVVSDGANKVVVKAPPHLAGKVTVAVETVGGRSEGGPPYTYTEPPLPPLPPLTTTTTSTAGKGGENGGPRPSGPPLRAVGKARGNSRTASLTVRYRFFVAGRLTLSATVVAVRRGSGAGKAAGCSSGRCRKLWRAARLVGVKGRVVRPGPLRLTLHGNRALRDLLRQGYTVVVRLLLVYAYPA